VKRALFAFTAMTLLMAAPAHAQTILQEESRFRTPQNWALELRFGPYTPEIDKEFTGPTDHQPFKTYFGDKRRWLLQLELDYQFFRAFGTAAVGFQAGYYWASTQALTAAGDPSGDKTRLQLFPMAVQAVYRLDTLARNLKLPLAPYGKLGLNYTIWRITDGNGDVARAGGGRGVGVTPGWQAAAGIALLMDVLDPGAARALDSDTGVNHTYIFAELARYGATGLGSKKVLRVGDTTWVFGLMFEF
jgi:hypothetical protein